MHDDHIVHRMRKVPGERSFVEFVGTKLGCVAEPQTGNGGKG